MADRQKKDHRGYQVERLGRHAAGQSLPEVGNVLIVVAVRWKKSPVWIKA